MNDILFSKNLIKGKIAQIIFEQMFREQGEYTVIPFGYENILPEIFPQRNNFEGAQRAIDNIRHAPDYTLISAKKEKVYLVEVKYRKELNIDEIKTIAAKQIQRWNPSCIFVATQNGFYFDLCSSILKKDTIQKLSDKMISKEIQDKYKILLCEFER
ncbi:MAG: hypothetical protein WC441_00575 [Patescibacteria group bacterium]